MSLLTMVLDQPARRRVLVLPRYLQRRDPALLEGFESVADWTVVSGTAANDSAKKSQGAQGIKLTTPASPFVVEIRRTLGVQVATATGFLGLDVFNPVHSTRTLQVQEYQAYPTRGRVYNRSITGYGWHRIPIRRSDAQSTVGGSTNLDAINTIVVKVTGSAQNEEFTVDNWQYDLDPVPALVFCLHDCWASHHGAAYPEFAARKMKASLFICTSGSSSPGAAGKMSWSQVNELEAAGWTVCNHTDDHTPLSSHPDQATRVQHIQDATTTLIANGIDAQSAGDFFTYPGPDTPTQTVYDAVVAAGIDLGINSNQAKPQFPAPDLRWLGIQRVINSGVSQATLEADVDAAAADGTILTYVAHDVSGTGDITVAKLQAVLDRCKQQRVAVLTVKDLWDLQGGPIAIPAQW